MDADVDTLHGEIDDCYVLLQGRSQELNIGGPCKPRRQEQSCVSKYYMTKVYIASK